LDAFDHVLPSWQIAEIRSAIEQSIERMIKDAGLTVSFAGRNTNGFRVVTKGIPSDIVNLAINEAGKVHNVFAFIANSEIASVLLGGFPQVSVRGDDRELTAVIMFSVLT
jgi:hypothetical protein